MTNEEILRVIEESKKQYQVYEEYRELATAEFFSLTSNREIQTTNTFDSISMESSVDACLAFPNSGVQLTR